MIEATNDSWLKLPVRARVITKSDFAGKTIPPRRIGAEMKRPRKTAERGKPERLLWSDDGARSSDFASSRESIETISNPEGPPSRENGCTRKLRHYSPRRKG